MLLLFLHFYSFKFTIFFSLIFLFSCVVFSLLVLRSRAPANFIQECGNTEREGKIEEHRYTGGVGPQERVPISGTFT